MADDSDKNDGSLGSPPDVQLEKTLGENIPSIGPDNLTPKQERENMEVHHHPDLHHKLKKWKEYFLEFLMIFLAVTLGFFAESLREKIVNNEKELRYIKSMVEDIKKDTAELSVKLQRQNYMVTKIDSALSIPVAKLADINVQDTFFHHFFFVYAWEDKFFQNDNTFTQLRNGGFNVIRRQEIIDSISLFNSFCANQVEDNGPII